MKAHSNSPNDTRAGTEIISFKSYHGTHRFIKCIGERKKKMLSSAAAWCSVYSIQWIRRFATDNGTHRLRNHGNHSGRCRNAFHQRIHARLAQAIRGSYDFDLDEINAGRANGIFVRVWTIWHSLIFSPSRKHLAVVLPIGISYLNRNHEMPTFYNPYAGAHYYCIRWKPGLLLHRHWLHWSSARWQNHWPSWGKEKPLSPPETSIHKKRLGASGWCSRLDFDSEERVQNCSIRAGSRRYHILFLSHGQPVFASRHPWP